MARTYPGRSAPTILVYPDFRFVQNARAAASALADARFPSDMSCAGGHEDGSMEFPQVQGA